MSAEQGETCDPVVEVPVVEVPVVEAPVVEAPVVEAPVVEASRGQRFAGWFLQVFGVILLALSGLSTPFWLGGLISGVAMGESAGVVIWSAAYFAGGLLGVVMGSLMRSAGMMMRGSVKLRDGRSVVFWAQCSVGKIACVVLGVGMVFGAMAALSAERFLISVGCMVVMGLLVPATVRLHSMRKKIQER